MVVELDSRVHSIDLYGLGGHGPNGALSPHDLRLHYGVPRGLTGVGQTIAIVDRPGVGDVEADLTVYSEYYHLPPCTKANSCFQQIDLSHGAPVSPQSDWSGETAMDTQLVHGIAPGAKIVLVTAAGPFYSDSFEAIKVAAQIPGVIAVSISFDTGFWNQSVQDPQFADFQAK